MKRIVTNKGTDEVAEFYTQYPFPNEPGFIDGLTTYFRRVLKPRHDAPFVLVIGCGTGEDLMAIRRLLPNAHINAIDASKNSVAIARERYPTEDIRNQTIETYAPKRKYDIIVCSGVLHHTKNPEANLKRIRTWLKHDGTMVLGVYHHARWETPVLPAANEAQIKDATEHPREKTYSWVSLSELTGQAGFKIKKTGHRLPVPHGYVLSRIYDGMFLFKRQQMMLVRMNPAPRPKSKSGR